MIRKLFLLFFTLLLAAVIISCGKTDGSKEVVITANIGPEPKTIDPGLNSTSDGAVYVLHAFEGLTSKDKDSKIIPGVAERWDISPDGLKYTFYLRTNAKWSDGKPVTANDFIYAWRRVVDPKVAADYSFQFEPIKNAKAISAGKMPVDSLSIKAIDDYTFEVILESPTSYFIDLAAFPAFFPVREDIVSKNPDDWSRSVETYVGNGPFVMTERKPDDSISMIKNTNYWNSKSIVPEKIKFVLMENPTASVAGVKEGSLHLSRSIPMQDIPTLQKEGLVKVMPLIGTYYYCVNVTNELLKDVRVRKALALAVDRNYIVEQVKKGGEIPATAWVPYGITDYEGSFREKGGDYYSAKKEDYQKSIEEAKKLLAEAGYPNGKGFPVLTFKSDARESHIIVFEAIQQMWKENLGIDSTISQEEWAVFQQTRTDKNIVVARGGWLGDFNDPMTFLALFLSYAPKNYGAYNNKVYDELIDRASKTADQKARMQLLHQAEDMILSDMALIPLYFYTEPVIMSPKLKNVIYDPLGYYRFDVATLEK